MEFDFEVFLVLATLLAGGIALADVVYFSKRRESGMPRWIEYGHSFFPVLLIVLLLRSFIVEPFRIPSGSLEPTLLPGDFVAANKFAYGLRLPISHQKILAIGEPRVGDIAIFRNPVDSSIDLIKRTIGVPGTKINYINKVLYINGQIQPQKYIGRAVDYDDIGNAIPVDKYEETINGITHDIYINPAVPAKDFQIVVPEGEYFMMGDNRDNSLDSRYWGFLPEGNLIGKAFLIWLSWENYYPYVRFYRMGKIINA